MRLVLVADPARPPASGVSGADLVERRLDLGADAGPAVDSGGAGTLLTVRSRAEGGAFDGTPAEAAALLARDAASAAFVDAERDVVPLLRAACGAGVRILASLHGRRTIDLPREGVDAWKIARPVESPADVGAALAEARRLAADFAAGRGPAAFVVPYGPLGVGLRVVCAAIAQGAGIDAFVYGVEDDADPAFCARLPHVPTLASLRDDLRLGEVSGRAALFGLVGRPPSASPSPRLHNAAFRSVGLDAVYLPEADLAPDAALALPYVGWSVTTPLKQEMARRCDDLDEFAARTGAVNTIVRGADGRLRGANTDVIALAEATHVTGGRAGTIALVLGGGGYARAAIVALRTNGHVVRVAGRGRARAAAAEFGVEFAGEDVVARGDERTVVNATPVGADGTLPEAWRRLVDALPADARVVDGPYAPGGLPGALAVAARARGLAAVDGGNLLATQAARQADLFTRGRVAPEVLRLALRRPRPLVLVGPRGAGKTTVGRLVARRLGRPFVDTDEELARVAGRPAGRVLAEAGEPAFRALEALVVARALRRRGAVIALGGGALESDETLALVERLAFVVRLDVSPDEAARRIERDAAPRPRLTSEPDLARECARLASAREPRYAKANGRVPTTGHDPADVASAVAHGWCAASGAE